MCNDILEKHYVDRLKLEAEKVDKRPTELKAELVVKLKNCPQCEVGRMLHTEIVRKAGYVHKCDSCSHRETYPDRYPMVLAVDIEGTEWVLTR